VLNVACGDGKFESLISAQVADQIEYEGMDFATKSVAQLKPRFPKLSFWSGDIITKRLAKQYDLICAFEILEHISDSQVLAVLKKFHQALTVGGYLMVAVPTNEPLLEMYPANPNQHVRAYTREIITAELELSGFTFVKVEQFSAFSSYYWLKKLLSKTFLRGYWQANDILVLVQK
jgi:trans-aconitate methyltransferase